jgi:hypothetical protein
VSGVHDQAILVGKETTYGTPVALTRAYEAKADTWKREQEAIESVGFRAGMHALRSDRRVQVTMGAAGEIEFDVLTNGFGLLAQGVFGSVTNPTQQGGTSAYKSTFQSASDASPVSFTIQKLAVNNAGTLQAFTYHGAVITEFELSQDVGGLLVAKMSFDAEDEDTTTAAGTPTYPAGAVPFNWTQAAVTVSGNAVEVTSFKFSANNGLKTDRRFLRGSSLKRAPRRAAVPEYSGEMMVEFADLTQYNNFKNGAIVPIVATWTGAVIGGSYNYEVKLTLAACQYDGTTPEASIDDLTMQALPFKVLHNGTDPAVKLEYTSTDTTL